MPASASQIEAPPRLGAPVWLGPVLAPVGLVFACLGAALSMGSATTTARPAAASFAAEPLAVSISTSTATSQPERIEVRSDALIITGTTGLVAPLQPPSSLEAPEQGLDAAVLIELSSQPGYEAWRAQHGRSLQDHLVIERYHGAGRTFLRASLVGAELPAVQSLLESTDGQLVRLDAR